MSTKQLRTTLTAAQLAASGQFLTATSTDAEAALGHTTRAEASVALQGVGMYARANILGTVSQSGGVPTGAVIQRGSNANGEFVRYADGTQICWGGLITLLSLSAGASAILSIPTSPIPFVGVVRRFYTVGLARLQPQGSPVNEQLQCLNGSVRFASTGWPEQPVIQNIGGNTSTSYTLSFLYSGRWF